MNNEIRFTNHGLERFFERTGFKGTEKKAKEYLKKAFREGKRYADFTKEEKQMYKFNPRKGGAVKQFRLGRVCAYNDNLYIFLSDNSLSTVLPKVVKSEGRN